MATLNLRHLGVAVAIWLLVVAAGIGILWSYTSIPGEAAAPPPQWPAETRVARAGDGWSLVLFLHPHCPCSRATVGELSLIMARARGRVAATVLFYAPDALGEDWVHTDLWKAAREVPGVRVVEDPQGVEAARFHGATSGQVLLYDPAGRLRFAGGITAGRGHSGDNAGADAVASLVTGGTSEYHVTSVYGCPLCNTAGGAPSCKKQ